ncbi:hypothetical protein NL108_013476 [Boleophthalmus pectinirostris]|uniref:peroxisomal membrane protein 11C-like n=1 Tax=Boleophthalmus pectinirostris TaxID=150288 RepID=UPI00242D6520|nr:peroxisomal membrane protein 11C-like [Boleophthalmus pectinirostris]KAJ0041574.1 hypothetical protein NL108_013476 [Boleophthalmus pectinirostris]
MQRAVEELVRVLETYRGRDKVIRTACYGAQLVGGVLCRDSSPDGSSRRLGRSLLLFSTQLSHCRTVLRLFDDLSMLAYSQSYGLGATVSVSTTPSHHKHHDIDLNSSHQISEYEMR